MHRIAGFCRFVDNKALALQKARYAQGEKKRDEHPGARDGNLAREGRDTPGWPVDRTTRVVGSRNPPKRRRGGSMPPLSAVGISGLQVGEDVKGRCSNQLSYAPVIFLRADLSGRTGTRRSGASARLVWIRMLSSDPVFSTPSVATEGDCRHALAMLPFEGLKL